MITYSKKEYTLFGEKVTLYQKDLKPYWMGFDRFKKQQPLKQHDNEH